MQRVDSMATDPPDDQFECEPGWVSCFRDCCERMVQFCNKRAKRCQGCDTRTVYCGNHTELPPECELYCFKLQLDDQGGTDDIYKILTYVFGSLLGALLLAIFCYCLWRKTQRQSHTYYVKTEDGSPASDSLLSLESADQGKTNDGNMEEDQEQEAEETGDPVSAPPSQPSPSTPSEAARATTTALRAEPWGQSLSTPRGQAPPTLTPEQPQPSHNNHDGSPSARQVEMPEPPQAESNQVDSGHHGPGNTTDTQHNRGCRDSRLYNVPPTTPDPDKNAAYPMEYAFTVNT